MSEYPDFRVDSNHYRWRSLTLERCILNKYLLGEKEYEFTSAQPAKKITIVVDG